MTTTRCPDPDETEAIEALNAAYELTKNEETPQYRDGRCSVRDTWDEAVAQALGIDVETIFEYAELLAKRAGGVTDELDENAYRAVRREAELSPNGQQLLIKGNHNVRQREQLPRRCRQRPTRTKRDDEIEQQQEHRNRYRSRRRTGGARSRRGDARPSTDAGREPGTVWSSPPKHGVARTTATTTGTASRSRTASSAASAASTVRTQGTGSGRSGRPTSSTSWPGPRPTTAASAEPTKELGGGSPRTCGT